MSNPTKWPCQPWVSRTSLVPPGRRVADHPCPRCGCAQAEDEAEIWCHCDADSTDPRTLED